ncbi:MAG: tyrosine-type recombinase/integrase [Muribaculaceae bacterium]|nr:tyrosine-type recombinase/integrase [Muribaculaceae bacterium]
MKPMTYIEKFMAYIKHELGYSPRTQEAYESDLRHWAQFATGGHPEELDAMSMSVGDLRLWVADMARRGVSPRTVRRKISTLRAFYRYLMKHHGLAKSPAAQLTMPRVSKDIPIYVRQAETEAILDSPVADDDFNAVRDRLILDIFYTTGIRCSELMALRDADVDTARGELKVVGKRNKERVIPFGPELSEAIDSYRRLRDSNPQTAISTADPTAPLLVKQDGQQLYRKMVYNVVHTQLTEGGAHAARLSPHVLRHSCATDLLNAGAPLASVQQLLGHASLTSTQVYTHVTYKDLKNNYQLAHPRAQKKGGHYGN